VGKGRYGGTNSLIVWLADSGLLGETAVGVVEGLDVSRALNL